jgi:hypothetical protein
VGLRPHRGVGGAGRATRRLRGAATRHKASASHATAGPLAVSGNLEFPVIPLPRPALMWAQARAFFVASYSLMTPVHHRQLATSRPTCCSHHEPAAKSNGQLSDERVHATADPQGHPSRRACRLLMSNVSAASVAKIPSAAAGSFCSVFEGRLARHSSRWSVRARTRVSVGKWPLSACWQSAARVKQRTHWRTPQNAN